MPVEKKVKSTKPLMEKRRRARINDSLMQLKTLVLDALNKNNPRHSKLEKADILEMTVRYLRTIQRQQIAASGKSDTTKFDQYRSGYAECVNEVTRYLGATTANESPELRTQLVGHLANLCTTRQQPSPTKTSSVSPQHHQQSHAVAYQYPTTVRHQQLADPSMVYPEAPRDSVAVNAMSPSVDATAAVPMRYNTVSPIPEGARAEFALTTPVYRKNEAPRVAVSTAATNGPQSPKNSTRLVLSPPMDVSGSLPSGEITLVLPQQALPNGQLPTHFIPVYAQGPAAVSPSAAVNANIRTDSLPNTGVSSVPSPRSASTFQPIVTDVSHRAISPSSAAPTSLSFTPHMQRQTELSPVTREHFAYPKSHMISAASHCATKKESMWRPW